jgi:hypothetical protein
VASSGSTRRVDWICLIGRHRVSRTRTCCRSSLPGPKPTEQTLVPGGAAGGHVSGTCLQFRKVVPSFTPHSWVSERGEVPQLAIVKRVGRHHVWLVLLSPTYCSPFHRKATTGWPRSTLPLHPPTPQALPRSAPAVTRPWSVSLSPSPSLPPLSLFFAASGAPASPRVLAHGHSRSTSDKFGRRLQRCGLVSRALGTEVVRPLSAEENLDRPNVDGERPNSLEPRVLFGFEHTELCYSQLPRLGLGLRATRRSASSDGVGGSRGEKEKLCVGQATRGDHDASLASLRALVARCPRHLQRSLSIERSRLSRAICEGLGPSRERGNPSPHGQDEHSLAQNGGD